MRRITFATLSVLVGVAIALAAFEVFAIAWLTWEDKAYISATERFNRLQNTYVRDATNAAGCTYADTLFPHPYLAFVHHDIPPCGLKRISNAGLTGDDFPSAKRDDRYVILLTGGSVAAQLGQVDVNPAPRYLEEELNARYVSPTGKPFQVINGGDGAWKQPQQLILFALYSNVVDAVVTLDGYNEVLMMNELQTQRLERPALNFLEVNPIAAQDGFGNVVVSWMAGRIAGAIGHHGLLGHSHAAYLVVKAVEHLAKGGGRFRSGGTVVFDRMYEIPSEIRSRPSGVLAFQLAQYRRYIRIMSAIAREEGVKVMFFLQPVPAIDKTLTDAEKQVNPNLKYGAHYREVVRALKELRQQGIEVVDILDVFAEEKGTIYADDVHPYRGPDGESRGYRLIAARMARDMATAWGLSGKRRHD
jgi:hypothetical protein